MARASDDRTRVGLLDSVAAVALVSAASLAVLYAGARVLEVRFAPFALVDWLARVAPGALITRAIEALVGALQIVGVNNLSAAAKTAEMLFGILLAWALIAGIGTCLQWWAPAPRRRSVAAGLGVGMVAGAALALMIAAVEAAAGMTGAIWTVGVLMAWGGVIGSMAAGLQSPGSVNAASDRQDADRQRRVLIAFGGTSAAVTIGGIAIGRIVSRQRTTPPVSEAWSAVEPLPNVDAEVVPVPGTRTELTPVSEHYRIDINTTAPRIDGPAWRLRVHGLVQHPLELTLAEIRRLPASHQFVTLSCISNPVAGSLIGTTRWSGVALRDLLARTHPHASATHVRLQSADGFDEVVAIDLARTDNRVMLAYDWDGVPLLPAHGFPLRVYVPDRYGMKQPKWIESIEAIDGWRPGYWVRRGWDREARMKATSVIDALQSAGDDGNRHLSVGGIAHAGARGVSAVYVQVDEGGWNPARLRAPLSDLTWIIWRYEATVAPGRHRISVRCIDGAGHGQIVEPSPAHPDGATGLHSRTVMA
jgi:DMSO/TMAO reductase YedYZ molybdopterin-dependent catalytic subunit